ncbi:MAG TPA: isochorismate synthase [Chloroflexota bacterium]|nr:isochorismate synthase [Chloroflexota bacterium]
MNALMVNVISGASLRLRRVLAEAVQTARRQRRVVLVSYSSPCPTVDPLVFFGRGRRLDIDRFYWERPADQVSLVGLGSVRVVRLHDSLRFIEAAQAWRCLLSDSLIEAEATSKVAVGPVLVGGFAFEPEDSYGLWWEGFPAGRLVVPRLVLTRQADNAWLTMNRLVRGEEDSETLASEFVEQVDLLIERQDTGRDPGLPVPVVAERMHVSASDWKALVEKTAAAARRGEVEKVVLARAESILARRVFRPEPVLERLREDYPGCTVFAVARRRACFLGATPERLVQLKDGQVKVSCLAGTTGRGQTSDEDDRLGERLLASHKNRAEHGIVARILRQNLGDLCSELVAPECPVLLKFRNVQHLYTPLAGRLRPGQTVLDVVERLHPTPAVGGFPREVALDLIRRTEGLDRGWYAGPIGWIDQRGDGDFVVAIRSALLRGSEAVLFAGCGIVAESVPEAEYEESCLKLQPMRSALRVR